MESLLRLSQVLIVPITQPVIHGQAQEGLVHLKPTLEKWQVRVPILVLLAMVLGAQ